MATEWEGTRKARSFLLQKKKKNIENEAPPLPLQKKNFPLYPNLSFLSLFPLSPLLSRPPPTSSPRGNRGRERSTSSCPR